MTRLRTLTKTMTRPHPIPHILLTLLLLITPTAATARGGEDRRAEVRATVTMPVSEHDDITLSEALRTCVGRAKIQAIKDMFGEFIGSTVILRNADFRSDTRSCVNGLWVSDTHEPEISVSYEAGVLVFKATVCGEAEEVVRHPVEGLECIVLDGGSDTKNYQWKTTADFHNDDVLGLKFNSKHEDGYLAVYSLDWDTDVVQAVLPPDGRSCEMVQKKRPMTWCPIYAKDASGRRGVLTVNTDHPQGNYNLFVLFSPTRISTCSAMHQSPGKLPECSSMEFHEWLAHEMLTDTQLTLEDISIRIHGDQ